MHVISVTFRIYFIATVTVKYIWTHSHSPNVFLIGVWDRKWPLTWTHTNKKKINNFPMITSQIGTFFLFNVFSTVHCFEEIGWVGQTDICVLYTNVYHARVFTVQAYQISPYVALRGSIFLSKWRSSSLCRLIRLLSTWCHAMAFFSASGATLSQEVLMLKWMSNQPALWTPDIIEVHKAND
jgi:hypothetical protein